jgi:hypothetical protein
MTNGAQDSASGGANFTIYCAPDGNEVISSIAMMTPTAYTPSIDGVNITGTNRLEYYLGTAGYEALKGKKITIDLLNPIPNDPNLKIVVSLGAGNSYVYNQY